MFIPKISRSTKLKCHAWIPTSCWKNYAVNCEASPTSFRFTLISDISSGVTSMFQESRTTHQMMLNPHSGMVIFVKKSSLVIIAKIYVIVLLCKWFNNLLSTTYIILEQIPLLRCNCLETYFPVQKQKPGYLSTFFPYLWPHTWMQPLDCTKYLEGRCTRYLTMTSLH